MVLLGFINIKNKGRPLLERQLSADHKITPIGFWNFININIFFQDNQYSRVDIRYSIQRSTIKGSYIGIKGKWPSLAHL
jgi:hypothetical protein